MPALAGFMLVPTRVKSFDASALPQSASLAGACSTMETDTTPAEPQP